MQPPVSAERPVIFSLHGIRTGGAWQKADLTRILSEAGFDHLALDFGFFRALRLLRPAVRRRQVDWFRDRYTAEMRGRSSLPSVIAHSFGTYIVEEAMRIYPEVCFNQVILCGSIVRRDFPWSKLIDANRVRRVLNDCGQRDFWAGIVAWAVDDAGPSGVQGFSDTAGGHVIQRSHPDWRHSDFFYELNYRRNWTPFLQGNMPGPPGTAAGGTTNWRFRVAVLMCLSLLAILGIILWPRIKHLPSLPVTQRIAVPAEEPVKPQSKELGRASETAVATAIPDGGQLNRPGVVDAGNTIISGVKMRGDRAIPGNTEVVIKNIGRRDIVETWIRLPWQTEYTKVTSPIVGTEIVLPITLALPIFAEADRATVKSLTNRLLADGILVWYDENELLPGDQVEATIRQEILRSDCVIVFVSKALASDVRQRRIRLKMALAERDRHSHTKPAVIPVLLDTSLDVLDELKGLHYVRISDADSYDKIKAAANRAAQSE
jgi:TIR domain